MGFATIRMEEFGCLSCLKKVKRGIQKEDGIENVTILFDYGKVKLTFNEEQFGLQEIQTKINHLKLKTFD